MEDDQTRSHRMLEVTPFTENIFSERLPEKIHMPDNVQPYDGDEDHVEHVGVFQLVVWVYNWNVATQCHMLERTLRSAARAWFENIPRESINSFYELREAFLKTFLNMKKHKERDERVYCSKRKKNEPMEDFARRFLAESRRAKKMPEAVKIAKFMKKVADAELIEHIIRRRNGKRGQEILQSRRGDQGLETMGMTFEDKPMEE